MPKCSVGSTDHVCKFLPKNIALCGRYCCLKFSPRNVYCLSYVICGSEVKTSDLAAHFSRNSGAANAVLFTIQTFNEHSRMAK